MALKHNLPASGDLCVSLLSRLCTVMPNMYRVGVSKVSPTARAAPGSLKFRGFRAGAEKGETPPLKVTALRQCRGAWSVAG